MSQYSSNLGVGPLASAAGRTTSILGPLDLVAPPTGQALLLSEARLQARYDADDESQDPLLTSYILTAEEFCEREIPGSRQFLSATYDLPLMCWWDGILRIPKPPLQSVLSVSYYDSNGTLQALDPSKYLVRTPLRTCGIIERAPFVVFPTYQADRRYPVVVRFTCGYGPSARIPLAVAATGSQIVTPGSMFGIFVGTRLQVDAGANQEIVTVSAVTDATFTAAFSKTHSTNVDVKAALPRVIKQALLMLVEFYNRNRDAALAAEGKIGAAEIPFSVTALLQTQDYGFYG